MSLLHYIKESDFLGDEVKFSIRNSGNFKTFFGGMLSIILTLSYFLFFMIFSFDILFKQNPNVVAQDIFSENYKNITLNKDNFLYAFQFQDYRGNQIKNDAEFLYVNAHYLVLKNNEVIIETKLNFLNCKNSSYYSFFTNNSMFEPSQWYCMDISHIENMVLGGYFEDIFMAFISFNVDFCFSNKFNEIKNNCIDAQLVKKKLEAEDIFIATLTNELIINPIDYETPIKTKLRYNMNVINFNLLKSDYVSYKNHRIEQDTGLLFSNTQQIFENTGFSGTERYMIYKTDEIMMSPRKSLFDNILYNSFLIADKKEILYSRSYKKLQDVLGNVNGFMDLLKFIFWMANFFYCNYRYQYFMINELLKVNKSKIDTSSDKCQDKLDKGRIVELKDLSSIRGKGGELKKIEVINNSNFAQNNSFMDKYCNIAYSSNRLKAPLSTQKIKDLIVEQDQDKSSRNLNNPHLKDIQNQLSHNNQAVDKLKNEEILECNQDRNVKLIDKIEEIIMKKNKIILKPKIYTFYFSWAFQCCYKNEYNKSRSNIAKLNLSNGKNQMQVFEKYIQKIFNKIDIIYYLRMTKKLKLLKNLTLELNVNKKLFDLLSRDLFNIREDALVINQNKNISSKDKNEKLISDLKLSIHNSTNDKKLNKNEIYTKLVEEFIKI